MILLDGKKLAEKIETGLRSNFSKIGTCPVLAIVCVGEHAVSEKFIKRKKALAERIGVGVKMFHYAGDISGTALRKHIADIVHDQKIHGVVIQLPLLSHLNTQDILNAVIPEKDVDMLSARSVGNFAVGKSFIMPPVVGAIDALFQEYAIEYKDKKIVIVGAGRLVGKPVADWLMLQNVPFSLLTSTVKDISIYTKDADIIISGAGVSKLITGDMVKDGVIVIDAATSEHEGGLVGDVDFTEVSKKAACITPVPGGIGPLTVVMIFKNLYTLITKIR